MTLDWWKENLKIGDTKSFKADSIVNYNELIKREDYVQVILNSELWNVLIIDNVKEYYVGILVEKIIDDFYELQRCQHWACSMQCGFSMNFCDGLNFICKTYEKRKNH
jgi:hypothetical protein